LRLPQSNLDLAPAVRLRSCCFEQIVAQPLLDLGFSQLHRQQPHSLPLLEPARVSDLGKQHRPGQPSQEQEQGQE
jgi:hypothetical protein